MSPSSGPGGASSNSTRPETKKTVSTRPPSTTWRCHKGLAFCNAILASVRHHGPLRHPTTLDALAAKPGWGRASFRCHAGISAMPGPFVRSVPTSSRTGPGILRHQALASFDATPVSCDADTLARLRTDPKAACRASLVHEAWMVCLGRGCCRVSLWVTVVKQALPPSAARSQAYKLGKVTSYPGPPSNVSLCSSASTLASPNQNLTTAMVHARAATMGIRGLALGEEPPYC